jgi:polygalacturonase
MYDVRNFGAAGDGLALDTQAIQEAIAACGAAGGTVIFPAGAYVTGALFLRDRVTLHLEAGATLLGSEDPAAYPIITGRWEGVEQETHAALIGGCGLEGIAVVGRGTVDGRGAAWWQRFRDGGLRHPRPRLISFTECRNVLIEGLILTRSPSWTINPVRCHNITIDKVTILNPPDSPNTDGINPDSCRNVHIANCHIDVGDDCIAIKSGAEAGDVAVRAPCENVTITNCTMVHGHGGIVIGSETSGSIRNVTISNCVFEGTDRGIRLKSRRGRGGIVEDIRVTNVIMVGVLCPFTVNLYYACGAWGDKDVADKQPQAVAAGTPRFRRIHLSHITARDAKLAAGFVYGLPEMPVEDLTLDDVAISMAPGDSRAEPGYPEMADDMELMQRAGLFARNVRGLRLRDVEITGQRGPALLLDDSVRMKDEG